MPSDTGNQEAQLQAVTGVLVTEAVTTSGSSLVKLISSGDWTASQRRYLVARAGHSRQEALELASVKQTTLEGWRLQPGFREAETAAASVEADTSIGLARSIAQKAAPLVMLRQAELATASHETLSDRQLVAQQRARDAIIRASGVSDGMDADADGLEPVAMVALKLWKKRRGEKDGEKLASSP